MLRAGSRTRHLYSASSLSRFGVGLKGAGFALARRITVLTCGDEGRVYRRAIDRDDIESTDVWAQDIRPATPEEMKFFGNTLAQLPGDSTGRKTGTIVTLDKVTVQTRDLSKLRSDLVRNAGEAYGKFLATTGHIRRLAIKVDDTAVEPFDPLHRENPETVLLIKRQQLDFEDGTRAFVTAVALRSPATRSQRRSTEIPLHAEGAGHLRLSQRSPNSQRRNVRPLWPRLSPEQLPRRIGVFVGRGPSLSGGRSKVTIVPSEDALSKMRPHVIAALKTANIMWREKDVLSPDDIRDLFKETNSLIESRAKLLVAAVQTRRRQIKTKEKPAPPPSPAQPSLESAAGIESEPKTSARTRDAGGYPRPVDHLPGDVLYRPRHDGDVEGVVVDINLGHPFSKAVFEVSPTDTKRAVPRRATTAIQQLLYVLGFCEFTMGDDEEIERQFEQFRRYASMNLSALLDQGAYNGNGASEGRGWRHGFQELPVRTSLVLIQDEAETQSHLLNISLGQVRFRSEGSPDYSPAPVSWASRCASDNDAPETTTPCPERQSITN